MKRLATLVGLTVLLSAVLTAPALAHHDGGGNLPPNNPHALGVPQDAWDAGTEVLLIVDEDGLPTGLFVLLDTEPKDFVAGHFWLIVRIGGEDGDYFAVEFEDFANTGEIVPVDPENDVFIHSLSGDPAVEGSDPGDYMYVLFYPHAHYVILHEGTARERCVDLANERELNHPNQHNAMHIGTPGHETPGGFANTGHEIHQGTCEDAGF